MKTKTVQRRNAKKKVAANSNQNSDPLLSNEDNEDSDPLLSNEDNEDSDPLLSNKKSAVYINMSPAFLDKDRWRGATIPFIRIGQGKGVIRYRQSILDAYLESRTEGPKLEEGK